jgi:hypothetical protein
MVLLPQQEQPAPCLLFISDKVVGALVLRSLIAIAVRLRGSMEARFGAVSSTRGDFASQMGQGIGRSYSDIGRTAVNGPHASHMYS